MPCMKILSLVFLFLSLNCLACVSDLKEDFKKTFDLKTDLQWRIQSVKLNRDELEDFFVTSEEQCGAKSCEGILYLQEKKNCFVNVRLVEGSFSLDSKITGGFHNIKINSRTYRFNRWKNRYD